MTDQEYGQRYFSRDVHCDVDGVTTRKDWKVGYNCNFWKKIVFDAGIAGRYVPTVSIVLKRIRIGSIFWSAMSAGNALRYAHLVRYDSLESVSQPKM
jgi:hypothetical protein